MKLSRRNLLRLGVGGAGAAALGLPWLASTAEAGPDVSNRRFVLLSLGHSIMPEPGQYAWLPPAGPLGALPRVLQPLSDFSDRMTVVGGIDNVVVRLVSSNGHNASSRTLLNCLPHADALNPDGSLIAPGMELDHTSQGGGPSIEYVMGDLLGTTPFTLRAGPRNGEHFRIFRLDGSTDRGEPDPRVAFDRLFGGSEPVMPTDAERLAARRADVLRTVEANHRAMSSRVGYEDRQRLESHANLVRDLVDELDRTVTITCTDPTLNVPGGFPDNVEDGEARADDVLVPTINSLIATTLGCSATRIVSLHYSAMQVNQFPFLNGGVDMFPADNWHAVVHHDGGTDEERYIAMGWYFEMVADLLRKLEAIPEGDGNVLDNTVVVLTSSLGSSSHDTNNLPFLLFGGSNSGLATGQTVDYRDSTPRSLGDMWNTCQTLMGLPPAPFGYDAGDVDGRPFNTGPLDELLG